jgi:molybdopterin-guanine dinucleotide biosynthesis protein MobB
MDLNEGQMNQKVSVVSIVGRSNSGKTTVLEWLIPALRERGYRLAVIKHHRHRDFAFDVPGKDSYRYAQAGAEHVLVVGPDKLAHVRHYEREPALAEIVAGLTDVDLVITEGYKRAPTPKIEVSRRARSRELISPPETLVAIVSDQRFDVDVPHLALDDVAGLADLIESRFLASAR